MESIIEIKNRETDQLIRKIHYLWALRTTFGKSFIRQFPANVLHIKLIRYGKIQRHCCGKYRTMQRL